MPKAKRSGGFDHEAASCFCAPFGDVYDGDEPGYMNVVVRTSTLVLAGLPVCVAFVGDDGGLSQPCGHYDVGDTA